MQLVPRTRRDLERQASCSPPPRPNQLEARHATRRTEWVGTHQHVLPLSLPACFLLPSRSQDIRRHAALIEADALPGTVGTDRTASVRAVHGSRERPSVGHVLRRLVRPQRVLPQTHGLKFPWALDWVQSAFGPSALVWSRHLCSAPEAHRAMYVPCVFPRGASQTEAEVQGWPSETEYGILGSNPPLCQVPNHTRSVRRVLLAAAHQKAFIFWNTE